MSSLSYESGKIAPIKFNEPFAPTFAPRKSASNCRNSFSQSSWFLLIADFFVFLLVPDGFVEVTAPVIADGEFVLDDVGSKEISGLYSSEGLSVNIFPTHII